MYHDAADSEGIPRKSRTTKKTRFHQSLLDEWRDVVRMIDLASKYPVYVCGEASEERVGKGIPHPGQLQSPPRSCRHPLRNTVVRRSKKIVGGTNTHYVVIILGGLLHFRFLCVMGNLPHK